MEWECSRCPQPPVLLGALHGASKGREIQELGLGRQHGRGSGRISGIKSEITDESIKIRIFSWHFNGDSCKKEKAHPILHSQPPALRSYLWVCCTSWVFSSPFLFSSFSSLLLQIELFKCIVWQAQIPAFPSLSPLAAISFSTFCSCIFRIISRVVPVAFIEICTKKDPSSMPPFQPWQEIYGGRKTPVVGRFCQEKERKEGKEMWWKSKGCPELGSREAPRR